MSTEEEIRWTQADYPMLSRRRALIDGLEKFDASFFKIHPKQADAMDPQGRILLEQAYSAILDAGINPATLRGSNTGVFAATCFDDTMGEIFAKPNHNNPYTILGYLKRKCKHFSNGSDQTISFKMSIDVPFKSTFIHFGPERTFIHAGLSMFVSDVRFNAGF